MHGPAQGTRPPARSSGRRRTTPRGVGRLVFKAALPIIHDYRLSLIVQFVRHAAPMKRGRSDRAPRPSSISLVAALQFWTMVTGSWAWAMPRAVVRHERIMSLSSLVPSRG